MKPSRRRERHSWKGSRLAALILPCAASLLLAFPAALIQAPSAAGSQARAPHPGAPLIQAAGRGNPSINMTDGYAVPASWSGPASLVSALQSSAARPMALAASDFDEDGVPDLVASYGLPSGAGLVTLSRGNVDAIYPNAPEARKRMTTGTWTPEPFLADVKAFPVPETPDYVGAGDFDADGHWDVVTAKQGGKALQLLKGDGLGNLSEAQGIDLAGAVTAMTVGEINRRDGLEDIVVGIDGPGGAQALVFEWPEGALRGAPEVLALPEPATSFALGQMDDAYPMDLAIAAGKHVTIVHGRDRKLSLDRAQRSTVTRAAVDDATVPYRVMQIALGDFDADRRPDLALLTDQDILRFLPAAQAASFDPLGLVEVKLSPGVSASDCALLAARVSSLPGLDLVLLDRRNYLLHVLSPARPAPVSTRIASRDVASSAETEGAAAAMSAAVAFSYAPMIEEPQISTMLRVEGTGAAAAPPIMLRAPPAPGLLPLSQIELQFPSNSWVTLAATSAPASALPMRLGADALDDLVVLGASAAAPSVLSTAPLVTHVVTNTLDSGPGSLRDAINLANATTSLDTISFNIPGPGPYVIHPLTDLPSLDFPVVVDATTQPGFLGKPVVEISAELALGRGLQVHAIASTIRGLSITGFLDAGIYFVQIYSDIVEGNFLGLTTAGLPRGNALGLSAIGTGLMRFGGTVAAARNVIADNSYQQVWIINLIDPTDLFNPVLVFSDKNIFEGNYVGTDPSGSFAAGTMTFGLEIGGRDNTIGGVVPGAGNVLASDTIALRLGNPSTPLSSGALVQGNRIGVDATGSAVVGFPDVGIYVSAHAGATIGGTTPPARNTVATAPDVASNKANVLVNSGSIVGGIAYSAVDLKVQGNFLGTDATGTHSLGGAYGIFVNARNTDHTIGGSIDGARNVIAGNSGPGVVISHAADPTLIPSRISVQGNWIGMGADGLPLPNNGPGIWIRGSFENVIGGADAASRNVISANTGEGILITDDGATDNLVLGNLIGTDTSGEMPFGNSLGIHIVGGSRTIIGGLASGEPNVISGNAIGVLVEGGATPGAGGSNQILGNLIGTNAAGNAPIGNANAIDIQDSPSNRIERNVVSGSTASGMAIIGGSSIGNVVKGNLIGVAADSSPMGNGGRGLVISGAIRTIVGGILTGEPNTVANNATEGIRVSAGTENAIRGNRIFDNAALGLDLGTAGVDLNDDQDPDAGANNLQNHPVLTGAATDGFNLHLDGTLNSSPGMSYIIDAYANTACDASGSGEGGAYLGSSTVVTDSAGNASFSFSLPVSVAAAAAITVTATDSAGNTSEFSACLPASPVSMSPTLLIWSPGTIHQLEWTTVPGAAAYKIYTGSAHILPFLMTSGADSCDRATTQASSSGKILIESPGPGNIYYYLVTAIDQSNVESFAGEGTAGLRQLNSVGACGLSCAHSKCFIGGPIEPACDPCVAQICDADPSCCGPNGWGSKCVADVLPVCGNVSCLAPPGQCAHSLCKAGTPLQPGCDQGVITPGCVARVCQADPACCQQDWGPSCVQEVSTLCNLNCD